MRPHTFDFSRLLLASVLASSMMACSGSPDESASAGSTETAGGAEEDLKGDIGESSNGKTVKVALGDAFTIALPSNAASSGFQWHVQVVDRTLGYPKTTYQAPDPHRIGASGLTRFTWSTKSPLDLAGKHEITLVLERPWSETVPPAETFRVTVDIVSPE
jgi:predicted secreted protein